MLYLFTGVNASYLGKHNSIPPMFRVIQQCARKHTTVLKLALEILYNLTKSSKYLWKGILSLDVSYAYSVFSLRTGLWPKCPPHNEFRPVQIAFEIFFSYDTNCKIKK